MAAENAHDTLATLRQPAADRSAHAGYYRVAERHEAALPPRRRASNAIIISHTRGQTVGSMAFAAGAPHCSDYRRFNVHIGRNDDHGAMREALTVRFQRHRDTLAGELRNDQPD